MNETGMLGLVITIVVAGAAAWVVAISVLVAFVF